MSKIKGKQIADHTITQNNMDITTASIINPTDVTTKEYVDQKINTGMSNLSYSSSDLNLPANLTTGTAPILGTARRITDKPQGGVRIYVNGVEVNVGANLDCFFAPEATGTPTPRTFGAEQLGDYFYWNPAVAPFQLETSDEIDYVYLTYTAIV